MRNFKQDFVSGSEHLSSFYPHVPGLLEPLKLIQARQKSPLHRETLVNSLRAQYSSLPEKSLVTENITRLGDDNTFTITTGHQLCLGSGPMFVIYKTITIIRQAAEWQLKYPQYQFVPIFWMASEDHDAAEINHLFPSPGVRADYAGSFQGPVGRHIIGTSIEEILKENQLDWLLPFYQAGMSWSEAFRGMMHHLFGDKGLVILDGDDAELKELFMPVIREELGQGISHTALSETSASVTQAYGELAHVREIHLYLFDGGERKAIKRSTVPGRFILGDGTEVSLPGEYTAKDFSPTALLRPLYQEWILPNLAYCGGWAEMAYWMQTGGLFKAYRLPYPALIPRYSATLITKSIAALIPDLNADPQDIENKIYESLWPSGPWHESAKEVIEIFDKLKSLASAVDQSLLRTLEGEQHKMQGFLQVQFLKKIRKQLRNRYPEKFNALDAWRSWKMPEQQLQERVLNISAFEKTPEEIIEFLYQYQGFQTGKTVEVVM